MVKTAIVTLAGVGVLGTGGQAIAPQSLEISTGAVTTEITKDGVESRKSASPEFGITWVTQSNKQITIRF